MDIHIQYWHWLVFGMVLIMAEIFASSFTIFWFGRGGLLVAGLMIVTLVLGVRIVPQGSKHVVQRLGKFHKTLGPGLNIIIPHIDSVSHKEAAGLEAEGRLEASKRDAKAKVALAEASQMAIQKVTQAIGDNEIPVMYLIGEKYVEALKRLSASENAKVVLMPAEIPTAIRGMLSGTK